MVVLSRSIELWAFSKLRKMRPFLFLYKFQMPPKIRDALNMIFELYTGYCCP